MTTQNANAGMKGTNNGHRHPCFSSYHVLNIQCASVQLCDITLWYNNTITIHFLTSIHFTSQLASRRPNVPRTLPGGGGGSSEVNRFKSSRQPMARRGATTSQHPPSIQSSLSMSSQISSIKRRYVVSLMSNAIRRSSLSVGIRPAPKTGS
jgi:hypothetical protein